MRTPDIVHVALSGELVYPDLPEIRMGVRAVVQAARPQLLCLDLSGVAHVDSWGFATLMGVASDASEVGATIRVNGVTDTLRGKLAMLGLLEALGVADDVPDPSGDATRLAMEIGTVAGSAEGTEPAVRGSAALQEPPTSV